MRAHSRSRNHQYEPHFYARTYQYEPLAHEIINVTPHRPPFRSLSRAMPTHLEPSSLESGLPPDEPVGGMHCALSRSVCADLSLENPSPIPQKKK